MLACRIVCLCHPGAASRPERTNGHMASSPPWLQVKVSKRRLPQGAPSDSLLHPRLLHVWIIVGWPRRVRRLRLAPGVPADS
jgi:hypothetical protein